MTFTILVVHYSLVNMLIYSCVKCQLVSSYTAVRSKKTVPVFIVFSKSILLK